MARSYNTELWHGKETDFIGYDAEMQQISWSIIFQLTFYSPFSFEEPDDKEHVSVYSYVPSV